MSPGAVFPAASTSRRFCAGLRCVFHYFWVSRWIFSAAGANLISRPCSRFPPAFTDRRHSHPLGFVPAQRQPLWVSFRRSSRQFRTSGPVQGPCRRPSRGSRGPPLGSRAGAAAARSGLSSDHRPLENSGPRRGFFKPHEGVFRPRRPDCCEPPPPPAQQPPVQNFRSRARPVPGPAPLQPPSTWASSSTMRASLSTLRRRKLDLGHPLPESPTQAGRRRPTSLRVSLRD